MSDDNDPTQTSAAPAGTGARKAGGRPAGAAGKGAAAGKRRAAVAGKGARAGAGKAAAPKAAPVPVTGPAEGGTLKVKELLTRVLARTGANRAAARPVIAAVLKELGDSLARGEAFALPPLGRGKIRPKKEGATGPAITVRLVQGKGKGKGKKDGETPLAPAEE